MTAWYKVSGDLTVRPSEVVAQLADEFHDKFGVSIGSIDRSLPTIWKIQIGFGDMFSHGQSEEIDAYLRQFADHVVEPAFLQTDYDNTGDVSLYIGPKDAESASQSKDTRARIGEMYQHLLPHDARAVVADLQSMPGVAYEDDSIDLGKLRSVREVQLVRLAADCRNNGVMLEAIPGEYGFRPNRDKDVEKFQKLQDAANGKG